MCIQNVMKVLNRISWSQRNMFVWHARIETQCRFVHFALVYICCFVSRLYLPILRIVHLVCFGVKFFCHLHCYCVFFNFFYFFYVFTFYSSPIHVIKLRMSTYSKRRLWWWWWLTDVLVFCNTQFLWPPCVCNFLVWSQQLDGQPAKCYRWRRPARHWKLQHF